MKLTGISLTIVINYKETLPLTELTGIRPGEEGKSPGSATKAKLKNTNVKGEKQTNKKTSTIVNFLIYMV